HFRPPQSLVPASPQNRPSASPSLPKKRINADRLSHLWPHENPPDSIGAEHALVLDTASPPAMTEKDGPQSSPRHPRALPAGPSSFVKTFAKRMDCRVKPGNDDQAWGGSAPSPRRRRCAHPPSSRRRSSLSRTPEIWRARIPRRRWTSVTAASA